MELSLSEAKKNLEYWRESCNKEYEIHQNMWQFSVNFAATKCKLWKKEVDRLEKGNSRGKRKKTLFSRVTKRTK